MDISCAINDCMESNISVLYCFDSVFAEMLRLGSSQLHGIMWIPTISVIVLGATFQLLPSATLKLKRRHECQEQKTRGSTISGKDGEGENDQPCSKMQREWSGGTWNSRYSRYLPCNCAQWFFGFFFLYWGGISLLLQAHGCDACDANVWAGWKTGVRNYFSEHFSLQTFPAWVQAPFPLCYSCSLLSACVDLFWSAASHLLENMWHRTLYIP